MSVVTPQSVFSELGVRQGSGSGRYFVGRAELLSEFAGCYSGETRSAAWLHGSRRIGKTSVAEELIRRAQQNGTHTCLVDAIDATTFEEMLERTCDRAEEQGISCAGVDARGRFEALARASSRRPLLLVFDEIDRIALRLDTSQQAFLRRIKGEQPKLGYLFISILDPARLVEEVPEINSRLLGVCTLGRVSPLRKREVEDLCRLAASDLHQPDIEKDGEAIWNAFGGVTLAVRVGLLKIVIARHHNPDFDDVERDAQLQAVADALETDLQGFWWSLQSATRSALAGMCRDEDAVDSLRVDGLYDRRRGLTGYRLLRERAGRWTDSSRGLSTEVHGGDVLDAAVRLFRSVADLNEALRYRGRPIAFRGGDQAFQLYRLARTPCTEDSFKTAIDFLYKVFYEGARAVSGMHPKAWLLSAPLDQEYSESEVVEAINELRCLHFHDKTRERDGEHANRHYASVGEIYSAYCGMPQPIDDTARAGVRDTIVRRLQELVNGLHERVASGALG